MLRRNWIGALAFAAAFAMAGAPAHAFDESKYLDFAGQWKKPRTNGTIAVINQWLASFRVDAENYRALGNDFPSRNLKRIIGDQDRLLTHLFQTFQIVSGFGFQRCAPASVANG